jgi:N-acetylmuramoyl-L-alanine amidase
MKTKWIQSPNFSERSSEIDAIVIHYTALPLSETIEKFKDRNSKVSSHYIIGRDGLLTRMVRDENKAWHAGRSSLCGRSNVNDFSIGIELESWGPLKKKGDRFFVWKDNWSQPYEGETPVFLKNRFWQPYAEEQYEALSALIKDLCKKHPAITKDRVKGHSDICLPAGRKIDPGEAFDWNRFLNTAFEPLNS